MTTPSHGRTSADILLVEDNPGDVRLVEEAFRDAGIDHELHVVTDGTEALDFCYRRGAYADAPRPDVILLDFNLSWMNGDEVLAELADDAELRRIPVVVLTGSEAQRDVTTSYDLGANAYVTKPSAPEAFLDVVRTVGEFWISIARLPDEDG